MVPSGDSAGQVRIAILFAAVHESPFGTKRTWRDVRLESAFGGKAEVGLQGRQDSFCPISDAPVTMYNAGFRKQSGLSSREFTSELLSLLNVTVLADSAPFQPLPWLLTLSNKRPLQMVPACLAAPLGFYVRAIQLRQHLPCKKLS